MRFFTRGTKYSKQIGLEAQSVSTMISRLVELSETVELLPPLSAVAKAKFDQEIAIEHLYYSSKIEGTALNNKQIDRAIHGKELAATS